MRSKTHIMIRIALFFILILSYTTVYAKTGKTTSETSRLREEASTDSNIVALISADSEVEILTEKGEWYQVKYNDGEESYTGYIRKDILNVQEETTSQDNETTSSTEEITQNTLSENQEGTNTETNLNTQINENQSEQNSSNTVEDIANDGSQTTVEEITVEKGYTTNISAKLDVKILPSISSSVIASIDENTKIEVTDVMNKWCYVQTENVSGWVLNSKISSLENNTVQEPEAVKENTEPESTQQPENNDTQEKENQNKTQTAYVSVETLNIREQAKTDAKIIIQLSKNTEVTILEKVDDNWSKVSAKGKTGYVSSKYLSDTKVSVTARSEKVERKTENKDTETEKEEKSKEPVQETTPKTENTEPTTSQTTSSTTGENIVAFAKQYLGSKYVSGGTSPSTGFDCSGFTTYVFKNFGISLSRTSSAQASNGVAVSRANLQAGDILVFNNSANSSIGHVGIYIGGNSFIHAANSRKGVIITSLSDSYYSPRFVTARRVIN